MFEIVNIDIFYETILYFTLRKNNVVRLYEKRNIKRNITKLSESNYV